MYEVIVTKPAEQDLIKAIRYINIDLQNPIAAKSLLDEIDTKISSLSEKPHRNPIVREKALAINGFSFICVKNYLVFYIVREETKKVLIQRILYGRRDWTALL